MPKKSQKLNPLAQLIVKVLSESGRPGHTEAYVAGKAADLAGMDVAATMAWIAYQLDQRNQEAVAKALSDATGRAIDLAGLAAGARAMQAALSLRGVA